MYFCFARHLLAWKRASIGKTKIRLFSLSIDESHRELPPNQQANHVLVPARNIHLHCGIQNDEVSERLINKSGNNQNSKYTNKNNSSNKSR